MDSEYTTTAPVKCEMNRVRRCNAIQGHSGSSTLFAETSCFMANVSTGIGLNVTQYGKRLQWNGLQWDGS